MNPGFPALMKVASFTQTGWTQKPLAELQKADVDYFVKHFDVEGKRFCSFRIHNAPISDLEQQFRTIRKVHLIVSSLLTHEVIAQSPQNRKRMNKIVNQLKGQNDNLLSSISEIVKPFFNHDDMLEIEKGRPLLHIAVAKGNVHDVQDLCRSGIPVDSRDDTGMTPFMLACAKGRLDIAEALLPFHPDINAQNQRGQTALHLTLAALPNTYNTIDLLLQLRASCNIQDREGTTALKQAFLIEASASCILQMLKSPGALLNYTVNKNEKPPFVAAIDQRRKDKKIWDDVCLRLIDLGVDVNQRRFGITPLYLAARARAGRVIQKLIEQGARLDSVDKDGHSIFQVLYPYSDDDYVDFTKICIAGLRARNADFTNIDGKGNSLLHFAATIWNPCCTEIILEQDFATPAFINQKNENGETPLSLAAASRFPCQDPIRRLVEKGASLNFIDKEGNTLLHRAGVKGNSFLIEKILERNFATNAFMNQKNQKGETALLSAAASHCTNDEACKLLVEKGSTLDVVDSAGNTLLHLSCAQGHFYLMEKILEQNFATADFVNQQNGKGETALALAAAFVQAGNRISHILVEEEPKANFNERVNNTILHLSQTHGHSFLIEKLRQQNFALLAEIDQLLNVAEANINKLENAEKKATSDWIHNEQEQALARLHAAALNQAYSKAALFADDAPIEMLLAKGARLDVVDKAGNTLLHRACRGGHLALIKKILEQNFATKEFLNARNASGSSALYLTMTHTHSWMGEGKTELAKEIFQVLLDKGAESDFIHADKEKMSTSVLHPSRDEIIKQLIYQATNFVYVMDDDERTNHPSLAAQLQELHIQPKPAENEEKKAQKKTCQSY